MIAYLNDIPVGFKKRSQLYKATVLESPDEIIEILHKRKLNFTPNTADLLEILEYIDTCNYLDCEFPLGPFFLERCTNRKAAVLRQMRDFEFSIVVDAKTKWSEYSYFSKTYEYNAVKALYEFYHASDMNLHAIRHGSLILFRYCCNFSAKESSQAVYHGRLDILDYIHNDRRGYAILANTWFQKQLCATAASTGNLNTLRYLREALLFEWDESCLEAAIEGDYSQCIEYIVGIENSILNPCIGSFVKKRERGFPITDLSIRAAISKNDRQLINGCHASVLVSYLLNA